MSAPSARRRASTFDLAGLRALRLGLLLAVLLCLALAPAPSASAQEDGGESSAVAVNDEDGSSIVDVAFQIRRVSSSVVDQTNTAVAYANCEACQTVAIAIQIVLVSGAPDTIAPTNVAVAINESCNTCQTLALAYQFVFGTGDVLQFTDEGREHLREIRKQLKSLEDSGLTVNEIRARAEELRLQIQELLATQLMPRGPGDEDDEAAADDRAAAGEEGPLSDEDGEGDVDQPSPEDEPPAESQEPVDEPAAIEPEPTGPAPTESAPAEPDPAEPVPDGDPAAPPDAP